VTADELRVGSAFTAAAQRLIYNPTTGALAYDSDGKNGPVSVVTIAFLQTGLSIDASDFAILT
jgi:hypothetical protein